MFATATVEAPCPAVAAAFNLGDFDLEDGSRIRNLTLAYATFGKLSPRKDNAILFPTWYSGTNKKLEQAYIGKDRALDPSRYFIILVNQIGNGLSSSPQNSAIAVQRCCLSASTDRR